LRRASIQHYVIVDPDKRLVIHDARAQGDVVATRIISGGELRLEPPDIAVIVAELFSPP
jgi:hypothetical protein